jgi:mycofactocin precursor peptide peptidase
VTRLVDARWPDVEVAARRMLIVPVGALEQHGPHLPLDTDAVIAGAVAARLHDLRPDAGLAPVLPIGASGEHAHFPGTLSIGTQALRLVIVELVRVAATHWAAVLVVNGHGGNRDALREAAELCRYEGRRLRVVHLGTAGMDAHAGRAETSMMLHLRPDRVRTDLAEPGVTDPLVTLLPALTRAGVRAVSPNGVLGDPSGASATEGARLVEQLVALALAAYDRCLATVSDDGPPS